MSDEGLLQELLQLEQEMHLAETRSNRVRMDQLLHPEFMEIGRSGKLYSRDDILDEFQSEAPLPAIGVSNVQLQALGKDHQLLNYLSWHEDPEPHRFTLRSSIWEQHCGEWRLRFHQGTPTE